MVAPEMLLALTEAHRNDILKEIERLRLLDKARAVRPRLQDRVLARVGSFLISAGKKLQGRYAPVRPHGSEAYQSNC